MLKDDKLTMILQIRNIKGEMESRRKSQRDILVLKVQQPKGKNYWMGLTSDV